MVNLLGTGSPSVQISPISSYFYPDARHVPKKYPKAQNKPPKKKTNLLFSQQPTSLAKPGPLVISHSRPFSLRLCDSYGDALSLK